jgi:Icc protein
VLQLSDPHLLADPRGSYRDRRPLVLLRHALQRSLVSAEAEGRPPDLLLLSGDLCQDESWGGYVRLRELLDELLPADLPVALMPGNHDHPQLLRSVLGRRSTIAPASVCLGSWRFLLLDSHQAAQTGGVLGDRQLQWLEQQLACGADPVLVAVHHPPVAIGHPELDAIRLRDGAALLTLLSRSESVRAVLFGHVHQHWRGSLPGRSGIPLLACPSTLNAFAAVQPCPLGREEDPGGRLLELRPCGTVRDHLLRWSPPDPPTLPV